MRVFYIVKVLQIIVAAIVIYRLMSVGEICEIHEIESQTDCRDRVTLYLPRRISDTQTSKNDSESEGETRTRRMDLVSGSIVSTVLTRKDPSLEEIHERHNAMKKRSDEKPAPRKTAAQTHQKRAVATHPTTSKSTSGQSVASRESQAEHHRTTVVVTEKPKSTAASAAKEITVASSEGSVKSSSPVTVAPKTEKPKASTVVETKASEEENSTQIAKADMTGSGKVVEKELPTESTANGRFRLKNTVDNCAPLHFWEMLGFGNDDLSHHVALRIPISTMIFSVFGVLMSIFHTFTNLSRPRRIRTFVENVAQVVLWTVCGVTLFLIRQDWEAKWAFGTAGSFGPIYPSAWQCAEFTCYVMVIAYLAECYFYDYNYYKLYFEETIGNYTVVERPEYGNSIYTSTVELAEDTAL